MQTERELLTSSARKVYRPSFTQRIGPLLRFSSLFLICSIAAVVLLVSPGPLFQKVFVPLVFGALAALMVWAYRWRTQVLLVTSPEGITYSSTNYRISTPWENVLGLGMRVENNEEKSRITGLELREPAPVFHVKRWSRFLMVKRADYFIPLSPVISNWQQGELAEDLRRYAPQVAEPLLQRALAICEQQLGPNHPDTAISLNSLAELYRSQGRYEEAEPLYQRALSIYEQQLGPEHPHTASSLNNLAELYQAQGKYEQAEPLLQRALAIYEQQLGREHPTTQTAHDNYVTLTRKMKREKE